MEEEPPLRPAESGEWGDLPGYLQSLQRRGADVKVPERYRRLFDAYVKNAGKRR